MKVSELQQLIRAENLTPQLTEDKEITCGYTCDLLSWVMAHGDEGMAWVTVQTHLNVVAVAALADMACVILPEDIVMEQESLDKANAEGMCVLTSPLTAYEICGLMAGQGVPAHPYSMETLFCDLHMHSCLSPCGSDDMTPSNLCGMAMLKGL